MPNQTARKHRPVHTYSEGIFLMAWFSVKFSPDYTDGLSLSAYAQKHITHMFMSLWRLTLQVPNKAEAADILFIINNFRVNKKLPSSNAY